MNNEIVIDLQCIVVYGLIASLQKNKNNRTIWVPTMDKILIWPVKGALQLEKEEYVNHWSIPFKILYKSIKKELTMI